MNLPVRVRSYLKSIVSSEEPEIRFRQRNDNDASPPILDVNVDSVRSSNRSLFF